jgi:hypothetical protein
VLRAATLLVIGCGSSSPARPPPPAEASAPPAAAAASVASDPLSYCTLAVAAVDELARCKGTTFGANRELYAGLATNRDPAFARKSGAMCAGFVEALLTEPDGKSCAFSFRDRRAELGAFLDAYYAERVKLEPTGHAGADAVLAAVAAHRDTVCACADEPCVRAVEKRDAGWDAKPLPKDAPAKARDLAGAMIDDIGKCSSDLRFARRK